MDRWGFALLCGVAVLTFVVAMPTLLDAAHDKGRFGTFTAVEKECEGRAGCDWTGSFVSDDETIHLDQVTYDGGGIGGSGDSVHAQLLDDDDPVVYAEHDKSWLWATAIAIPCAAYLCWWISKKRWRETADGG
jgi:hypothetical protein